MFDTDKFIECVHEKAAIWDKSTKDYSDKVIREKSWIEIAETFYDHWSELDTSEKDEKVKELKNKWRHIRDNFLRFLNRGKSGDPPTKTKKYIYADALQFLQSTVEKRRTSGNIVENFEEDSNGEKEENENDDDKEQREHSESRSKTRSLKSTQSASHQRNITPFQRELLKKLHEDTSNQEDADKSFLVSLLPDYKKLNDEAKLDFRLLTLQFFKNRQQNKNVHHLRINPSTQAYFQPRMAVDHVQSDGSYLVNPSFHLRPPPSPAPSPSMLQRSSPAETSSPSLMQSPPPINASKFCLQMNDKPLPPTYVEGFHDLEAVKAMEYRTLGKTGLLVSKLSFGGGPLGCHYGPFDEAEAIETLRHAIRQGVNYIDTAPWYGQGRSEAVIGKALRGIPRNAYYIATKVGRYELDFDRMFDFSVEKTRKSLKKSLELLQLDYVDVIQVHDIEFAPSLDIIVTRTLPELSKQVRDGNARYIGITGYPVSILKECVERSNITISCVLTYSRYTLIDETLLDYVDFFKKNNIGVINASGVCMGLLTNDGPPEWHPSSKEVREECAKARQCCKDHDQNLARLAVWNSLQCENVATNLIGMQNMSDLTSNLDVMRNGISDKEKDLLRDLQEKYLSKVKGCHWEGREIEAYRRATNRL